MARAVGGDEVRADALSATALVEQAGAGCEGSWQELVDRHLPLVAAVCTAHGLTPAGSAEVNQVVWLRLAERLLHICEPEGLGDWIAARTRALCLDVRWSGARRGDVVADLPPPPGPARHGPEVAFARVGVRCQRVLRLAALTPAPADGEVGAALDLAADEVRRSCARCLQRLGRMTGRSPDAVLPELRAALARHPGVPGEWQAASHAAFVWLLLDVPSSLVRYYNCRRACRRPRTGR